MTGTEERAAAASVTNARRLWTETPTRPTNRRRPEFFVVRNTETDEVLTRLSVHYNREPDTRAVGRARSRAHSRADALKLSGIPAAVRPVGENPSE
jgi:hypothetical protein